MLAVKTDIESDSKTVYLAKVVEKAPNDWLAVVSLCSDSYAPSVNTCYWHSAGSTAPAAGAESGQLSV